MLSDAFINNTFSCEKRWRQSIVRAPRMRQMHVGYRDQCGVANACHVRGKIMDNWLRRSGLRLK